MKKLLFILLMLPMFALAQTQPPVDSITHKISYEGVVQATGTKDQLYDRALIWFSKTFRSSKDVIQISDKVNGRIGAKWYYQPYDDRTGFVLIDFTVLLKDGRYKYIFTDLYYEGTSEYRPWALEDDPGIFKANMMKGAQRRIKENTFAAIGVMIDELKRYMVIANKDSDF